MHYPIARAALDGGFHVMCDKPVTTFAEALSLQQQIQHSGVTFGLTHNYTGYAMVREARQLVRSGAIGEIRRVNCEYPQRLVGASRTRQQTGAMANRSQQGWCGGVFWRYWQPRGKSAELCHGFRD